MKKKLFVLVLASLLIVSMASFAETSNNSTYGKVLYDVGLIKGDGNGLNPEADMKREELITIVNRISEYRDEFAAFKAPKEPTFSDVSPSDWAYKQIEFAVEKGLTKGVGGGKFGYGQKSTANQLSMFLLRAMKHPKINDAVEAFDYHKSYEVLSGVMGETIDKLTDNPDAYINRADMFETLYKSLISNIASVSDKTKNFYEIAINGSHNIDKFVEIINDKALSLLNDIDLHIDIVVDGSDNEGSTGHDDENNQGGNGEGGGVKPPNPIDLYDAYYMTPNDVSSLGFNILEKSFRENSAKSTIISPTSIVNALSLAANGAKGETRDEMESLLGGKVENINRFMKEYNDSLASYENCKFVSANSIWINSGNSFRIKPEFLMAAKEYYKSFVFFGLFDDNTKNKINSWVADKTSNLIKNAVNEINPKAIMYIINALSFDAKWAEKYTTDDIIKGSFTTASGDVEYGTFMQSIEHKYIENDYAEGIVKDYESGHYSFVALLPKGETNVKELLRSLMNDDVPKMIAKASSEDVKAKLPIFKTEFGTSLKETLKSLNMTYAFDPDEADFSGIANPASFNIFIESVIHKAIIQVDEAGTKAGAVTVIGFETTSVNPEEMKEVYFDKPFVYMIVDKNYNIPIFAGVLMNIK